MQTRRAKEEATYGSLAEYSAALFLKLESAWKTGTPETAPVSIPLGHLLDILADHARIRAELLEVRRAERTRARATAGSVDIPFSPIYPGIPVKTRQGSLLILEIAPPRDHPILEENARLFEAQI